MKNKFTAFQEEWLQALESGKYVQGELKLSTDNEYCCLGVACEVYNERQKRHKKKLLTVEIVRYIGRWIKQYNKQQSYLPTEVYKKLKLKSRDGTFNTAVDFGKVTYTCLTNMNDDGVTHKDIAKYIRNNPENVFLNFAK